jgi:hypothetical protein
MTAVALVWFTLKGRGGAIVRAKWDALLGLGSVLAARRQVQGARTVPVSAIRDRLDRSSLLARFLGAGRRRD